MLFNIPSLGPATSPELLIMSSEVRPAVEYDYCPDCGKKGVTKTYHYGRHYSCRYCDWGYTEDSGGKA